MTCPCFAGSQPTPITLKRKSTIESVPDKHVLSTMKTPGTGLTAKKRKTGRKYVGDECFDPSAETPKPERSPSVRTFDLSPASSPVKSRRDSSPSSPVKSAPLKPIVRTYGSRKQRKMDSEKSTTKTDKPKFDQAAGSQIIVTEKTKHGSAKLSTQSHPKQNTSINDNIITRSNDTNGKMMKINDAVNDRLVVSLIKLKECEKPRSESDTSQSETSSVSDPADRCSGAATDETESTFAVKRPLRTYVRCADGKIRDKSKVQAMQISPKKVNAKKSATSCKSDSDKLTDRVESRIDTSNPFVGKSGTLPVPKIHHAEREVPSKSNEKYDMESSRKFESTKVGSSSQKSHSALPLDKPAKTISNAAKSMNLDEITTDNHQKHTILTMDFKDQVSRPISRPVAKSIQRTKPVWQNDAEDGQDERCPFFNPEHLLTKEPRKPPVAGEIVTGFAEDVKVKPNVIPKPAPEPLYPIDLLKTQLPFEISEEGCPFISPECEATENNSTGSHSNSIFNSSVTKEEDENVFAKPNMHAMDSSNNVIDLTGDSDEGDENKCLESSDSDVFEPKSKRQKFDPCVDQPADKTHETEIIIPKLNEISSVQSQNGEDQVRCSERSRSMEQPNPSIPNDVDMSAEIMKNGDHVSEDPISDECQDVQISDPLPRNTLMCVSNDFQTPVKVVNQKDDKDKVNELQAVEHPSDDAAVPNDIVDNPNSNLNSQEKTATNETEAMEPTADDSSEKATIDGNNVTKNEGSLSTSELNLEEVGVTMEKNEIVSTSAAQLNDVCKVVEIRSPLKNSDSQDKEDEQPQAMATPERESDEILHLNAVSTADTAHESDVEMICFENPAKSVDHNRDNTGKIDYKENIGAENGSKMAEIDIVSEPPALETSQMRLDGKTDQEQTDQQLHVSDDDTKDIADDCHKTVEVGHCTDCTLSISDHRTTDLSRPPESVSADDDTVKDTSLEAKGQMNHLSLIKDDLSVDHNKKNSMTEVSPLDEPGPPASQSGEQNMIEPKAVVKSETKLEKSVGDALLMTSNNSPEYSQPKGGFVPARNRCDQVVRAHDKDDHKTMEHITKPDVIDRQAVVKSSECKEVAEFTELSAADINEEATQPIMDSGNTATSPVTEPKHNLLEPITLSVCTEVEHVPHVASVEHTVVGTSLLCESPETAHAVCSATSTQELEHCTSSVTVEGNVLVLESTVPSCGSLPVPDPIVSQQSVEEETEGTKEASEDDNAISGIKKALAQDSTDAGTSLVPDPITSPQSVEEETEGTKEAALNENSVSENKKVLAGTSVVRDLIASRRFVEEEIECSEGTSVDGSSVSVKEKVLVLEPTVAPSESSLVPDPAVSPPSFEEKTECSKETSVDTTSVSVKEKVLVLELTVAPSESLLVPDPTVSPQSSKEETEGAIGTSVDDTSVSEKEEVLVPEFMNSSKSSLVQDPIVSPQSVEEETKCTKGASVGDFSVSATPSEPLPHPDATVSPQSVEHVSEGTNRTPVNDRSAIVTVTTRQSVPTLTWLAQCAVSKVDNGKSCEPSLSPEKICELDHDSEMYDTLLPNMVSDSVNSADVVNLSSDNQHSASEMNCQVDQPSSKDKEFFDEEPSGSVCSTAPVQISTDMKSNASPRHHTVTAITGDVEIEPKKVKNQSEKEFGAGESHFRSLGGITSINTEQSDIVPSKPISKEKVSTLASGSVETPIPENTDIHQSIPMAPNETANADADTRDRTNMMQEKTSAFDGGTTNTLTSKTSGINFVENETNACEENQYGKPSDESFESMNDYSLSLSYEDDDDANPPGDIWPSLSSSPSLSEHSENDLEIPTTQQSRDSKTIENDPQQAHLALSAEGSPSVSDNNSNPHLTQAGSVGDEVFDTQILQNQNLPGESQKSETPPKRSVTEVCACDTTTGSTDDEHGSTPPVINVSPESAERTEIIPESSSQHHQKVPGRLGRREWGKELTKIRMKLLEKKKQKTQERIQRAIQSRKKSLNARQAKQVVTEMGNSGGPKSGQSQHPPTKDSSISCTSKPPELPSKAKEVANAVEKLIHATEPVTKATTSSVLTAYEIHNLSKSAVTEKEKTEAARLPALTFDKIEIVEDDDEDDEPWPFEASPVDSESDQSRDAVPLVQEAAPVDTGKSQAGTAKPYPPIVTAILDNYSGKSLGPTGLQIIQPVLGSAKTTKSKRGRGKYARGIVTNKPLQKILPKTPVMISDGENDIIIAHASPAAVEAKNKSKSPTAKKTLSPTKSMVGNKASSLNEPIGLKSPPAVRSPTAVKSPPVVRNPPGKRSLTQSGVASTTTSESSPMKPKTASMRSPVQTLVSPSPANFSPLLPQKLSSPNTTSAAVNLSFLEPVQAKMKRSSERGQDIVDR